MEKINTNNTNNNNNKAVIGNGINQEEWKKLREHDLHELRAKGINPYPHKFEPNSKYSIISVHEFITRFQHLTVGMSDPNSTVAIIGRLITVRASSKKLVFFDVNDFNHDTLSTLQVMANLREYLEGEEHFFAMTTHTRIGDWVGFSGHPSRTSRGELSLIPHSIQLLTPCVAMLPPRVAGGLIDPETRFRQRYLDLIINQSNMNIFRVRASIIKFIRGFMDELNLLEVDTPVLNTTVGGANAKPFDTYSNAFNIRMFMRIAPELYLKMLMIGGYNGVYELGRQFRNESADLTHNPEFTSLECYIRNYDYVDMMDMCEKLFSTLVFKITGSYVIKYDGKDIDFTPPFRRFDMMEELEKASGISFQTMDYTSEQTRELLDAKAIELGVECTKPRTTTRLLDKFVGHFVESQCVNPAFVINHPLCMSPLAKEHRSKPGLTERFELFANCFELANSYTELNDPKVQYDRFASQSNLKAQGDEEAMVLDKDFVRALEYGLPPTGGFGLGVDRLVMLLTDKQSIKEVIPFPTMKPENLFLSS